MIEQMEGVRSEYSFHSNQTCPICLGSLTQAESIMTLQCGHRFCKECFVSFIANKINEGLNGDPVCPVIIDCKTNKSCNTLITPEEILSYQPSSMQIKFHHFMIRKLCESDEFCACPKCHQYIVHVPSFTQEGNNEDDELAWTKVTCLHCSNKFCGKCGQIPHYEEITSCEEYAKSLLLSALDAQFLEYVNAHRIFPCPGCKMYGELVSGCKMIYCRCRTSYCALCGVQLIESQHYAHFLNQPYGNRCKGVNDQEGVVGK